MNNSLNQDSDYINQEIMISKTIQEFEENQKKGKYFNIAHSPIFYENVCSNNIKNNFENIFKKQISRDK